MEYSGLAASWDRVVVRGDLAARTFIAFWLKDQRVVAGMNANVWDVTESIQALIRSGRPVDPARLADPDPPGPDDQRAGDNEHPMTKLRQLHDRYGQSSWLTTAPRQASPATTRCGSQTDVFPGHDDRREK